MDSTRRKSRSSKRLSSAPAESSSASTETQLRTTQLETHQEQHQHVSSQSSAVNDHGKRISKTTTITESVSRKAKSGVNTENFAYVQDNWELRPKTDYTYAHSASYSPAQIATPKPPSPNMSRRRLRGGLSIAVTPITSDHSAESGVRVPSPAGTRSGLKYGIAGGMLHQGNESAQQSRVYTDYLRPQRAEENMEGVRQQLNYTPHQDPSLSHLWGPDQEDGAIPDSTQSGSRYFDLFIWFLQTIVTTVVYPVTWLFRKDTTREEIVASSMSEQSDDESDGEDVERTEQPERMGFMAGFINQVICVFSFVFISLPLACGLSTIWVFGGNQTEVEEEEEEEGEEEEVVAEEVIDESSILSETVLSGSLGEADVADTEDIQEESSFCEEIPEWMFWGMSSVLITLPSAIWETVTSVFRSRQDVTDVASDDGYDEVDRILIESGERTWLQCLLLIPYSVFIGFPLVLANSAQNAIGFSSEEGTVWKFIQDHVIFWPYFIFVAVPVYVGRFCIDSVCAVFGTRKESESLEEEEKEEDGVVENQLLDLILTPFYAVLIKAPLSVGNYVLSSLTRVSTTEEEEVDVVEIEPRESVFKKMITGLLLFPYFLIFTVPTGMGRLALRMAKGEEEIVLVTDETEAEISDGEEEDVLVGTEVYADRIVCMRWLLNLVNGLLVVASFLLVTLPTGFGLYVWSFFAKTGIENQEDSDNEEEDEEREASPQGEGLISESDETSLLRQTADFIVHLPFYIFIWLPTKTVNGLSTAVVSSFNALTRGLSHAWDLWWDVVIWVVTRPYYVGRALMGVKDEVNIDAHEETVKVRRRSTRSSMAAKTLAAGVLADSQTAEGAVLLEESDSGIDSADEVDSARTGVDAQRESLQEKVSKWLTWPFYFVILTIPIRIGNCALGVIESIVDSVCSAGENTLSTGQQAGISLHQSVTSAISANASVLAITSQPSRRWGRCCVVPLILLLSLFLLGALYAWSCGGFVLPLLIPLSEDSTVPPPCCTTPCGAPSQLGVLPFSDAELESKIRSVLAGYLSESSKEKERQQSEQHSALVLQQQQIVLNAYKTEMEADIVEIVQKQIDALAGTLNSDNEITQQQLAASVAAAKAEILNARLGDRDTAKLSDDALAAVHGRIDGLQASVAQLDAKQNDESAEIAALQAQFDGVLAKSVAVAADLDKARLNAKTDDDTVLLVAALEERLKALMGDVGALNAAQALLLNDTKACCQNETGLLLLIQSAVAAEAAKFQAKDVGAGLLASGLSEDRVMMLIQNALAIYEADKTGRVDYALESAGGSIVSTRCTETYNRRTTEISIFGIPLWYATNSPRTVIQPDMQPGQCWAFKGARGFLVMQMMTPILPTAFSLEHIPKSLSPNALIESAPKDFSVWGLSDEYDTEGIVLGNYSYQDNGDTLQFFPVKEAQTDPYRYVELRITSNHGNPEYTCLYRFRVHGTPFHS